MKFVDIEPKLTFDDVILVPNFSKVESRSNVSLEGGKLKLKIPIISANMDSITEFEMARTLHQEGGLGIIHRFLEMDELDEIVFQLKEERCNFGISIGLDFSKYKRAVELAKYHDVEIICIDVAHGNCRKMLKTIDLTKKIYPDVIIIAGNVATYEGAKNLLHGGADIIKVGIGPGSHCTTRMVTGHGYPQLSAILECAAAAYELKGEIIADGGIRTSGDIAKALAAGANYVMIGRLLAGCKESCGDVVATNGPNTKFYKAYRGMASREVYDKIGKDGATPEGVASLVPFSGSAHSVLSELAGGLRSALSYSGAHSVTEFKRRAVFARVTPNGLIEGRPHGKN